MKHKITEYFSKSSEQKADDDDLCRENKFLRERADYWCGIATDLRIRMNTMRARIAENKDELLGTRAGQLVRVLESLCKDPEEIPYGIVKPAPTSDISDEPKRTDPQ